MYYNLFKIGIHCTAKSGIHLWYYRYCNPKTRKTKYFQGLSGRFVTKSAKSDMPFRITTHLLKCVCTFLIFSYNREFPNIVYIRGCIR